MSAGETPTIGLLPWGNVIEDFLEPAGLTREQLCEELTGSWMFTWARALRTAGVETEIAFVTRERREARATHRPTGTPLVFLPTTRAYRAADGRMGYPYGATVRQVFAQESEPRGARRLAMELVREVAPYLATPPVRLARAARRGRWRAILCQEYEYPRFEVAVALGRLLGLRVVGSFHGGVHRHGRLERLLRPGAVALASALTIGPADELERARSLYRLGPGKVARIVNPVDLDLWRPGDRDAARAELGLPRDAGVVAWHGRVAVHHKGLDHLLEAWRLLTGNGGRELRLMLIGGGSDAEEVERMVAELELPGVLRIDRHVHDPAQLARWLAAADVWTLASRHEGFPVALIEALACGLPVVATRVTGVADILGPGDEVPGLTVPPGDPGALATALGRLLGDPELRGRLQALARARAERRFSLEAVGGELRQVLIGDPWP